MSLKLAKNNAPAYDYLSVGDGANPASASATLDNTGGTVDSGAIALYLVATLFRYTGIAVTIINEQAGIDWKVSLDAGATWADTVNPADMNALGGDVILPIHLKFVAQNNGTVATGLYTVPDIQVTATEQAA